jgi:hypothetical protein
MSASRAVLEIGVCIKRMRIVRAKAKLLAKLQKNPEKPLSENDSQRPSHSESC